MTRRFDNQYDSHMSKQRNTPEYRADKRITAFVDPQLKQMVLAAAKEADRSMSEEVKIALATYYYGSS